MFCWCKSITFAGLNQLSMTWFHFSLKGDHYNDHFKLVKIDSFPVVADITNRGSYHKYGRRFLLRIGTTHIINRGRSYNYKSGQNYYKSEQLQTITIWERFIINQGSYCKSGHLLKINAQQYYTK